jgi:hypothetical protein
VVSEGHRVTVDGAHYPLAGERAEVLDCGHGDSPLVRASDNGRGQRMLAPFLKACGQMQECDRILFRQRNY